MGGDPDGAAFPTLDSFLGTLREIGAEHDVLVQAFDARYVAGRPHLESALEHAKRSKERGENVADDLAVEVLCYAAGRRQIDEAMELGVSAGEQPVVVLLAGDRESDAAAAVAERAIEPGPVEPSERRLTAFFGITDAERAVTSGTLTDLVCERVALLDVEK
ncbi:MAG: KEOPS complex subunit Cgi121 [Halodesulfurarchaeum sp.]